jgi:PIN domain nuclease of toxin-antitoxin system
MRVLLDTHAFLWWVTDDPQLSSTSRSIIADSGNILFLSVASVWEIVIKTKSGKLTLPESVEEYIPNRLALNRFESLDIQMTHTL